MNARLLQQLADINLLKNKNNVLGFLPQEFFNLSFLEILECLAIKKGSRYSMKLIIVFIT